MIGLCTDSGSQLPGSLAERFGIEVVPVTVTVGDHEFLDGVDLDPLKFQQLPVNLRRSVRHGHPSPGQFAAAYDDLVARGCSEIVSVHANAGVPGTVNAARLAAHSVPIPVRIVGCATTGFGVSCCAWAAADAIAGGASLDRVVLAAEALPPAIAHVFLVCSPGDGVPVLTVTDGQVQRIGVLPTMADAVNAMAAFVLAWGDRLRVGVGVGEESAIPIGDALAGALGEAANVVEAVRYRVGASGSVLDENGVPVEADTVSCFAFPAR